VSTTAIFFPFDLFGSAGTGAGVALLADELRELLADNRRETAVTRARAYSHQLHLREFVFEELAAYRDWRRQARRAVRQVWRKGAFLVWITGNHLGTLPVYEELATQEGGLVIQFDAHLDIHHFVSCTKQPSHGNFLLHADGPLPALINLGHRDLLLPPDYIRQHYTFSIAADQLVSESAVARRQVQEAVAAADRILIDIDCDVLDPSCFSAVTHPVPFGLTAAQLLSWVNVVWSERVIGLSLSEFDPARDRDDQGLAVLVWLLEYLLLKRHEQS
jgi:arginase family enzyme